MCIKDANISASANLVKSPPSSHLKEMYSGTCFEGPLNFTIERTGDRNAKAKNFQREYDFKKWPYKLGDRFYFIILPNGDCTAMNVGPLFSSL